MFDQAVWLIMWLEHWTYNFEDLIASPTLTTLHFVHGSPKFKSSLMLVNNPSWFASDQLGFLSLLSLV